MGLLPCPFRRRAQLGPAMGRKHPYNLERKTVDDLPRPDGRKPLDFRGR